MGALAQYIESEGVATTQISLIREHTVAIEPPRALWVSFMLGRPFGVPNDAAFQERVLIAALRLLEAPAGPVLVDYPEDAPACEETSGQVCPVSFAQEAQGDGLAPAFLREIEALQPWHDLARERRGRSTVGLSDMSIDEAARIVCDGANGGAISRPGATSAGEMLKLACEDVRAFYYEAAAARPGAPDAEAIQNWFWNDTAAGRVFLALHARCSASEDKSLQRLCATSLVPRAVMHGMRKA